MAHNGSATAVNVTEPEIVSFDDLRMLAEATGLCISAAVAIPEPAHIRPAVNNTSRELEKQLKQTKCNPEIAQTLLQPFQELAATLEQEGDWGVALAIYRSPDIFRHFRLWHTPTEEQVISQQFQISHLLPLLAREQRFYLLALSQHKARLFFCTQFHVEEVDAAGFMPQNLDDFLHERQPDHVLDNRSTGGPDVGSMKGVMFGTGTDRERQDEYLRHFFKEIDKGIHKLAGNQPIPLLLAGVEYEIAIYRHVSVYKYLMDQASTGATDRLSANELHKQGVEIVRNNLSLQAARIMNEFKRNRDGNRVVFDAREILARAEEGRVGNLLLREDAAGEQNQAAIEVIKRGGQVFALRATEMPENAELAAILRY